MCGIPEVSLQATHRRDEIPFISHPEEEGSATDVRASADCEQRPRHINAATPARHPEPRVRISSPAVDVRERIEPESVLHLATRDEILTSLPGPRSSERRMRAAA